MKSFDQTYPLVPNDLGLSIPGNIPFFEVLIVLSFILHIICVNVLVAGSVSAVYLRIKSWLHRDEVANQLGLRVATQVSIVKSIAVVLGIAPLLIISTIYTQYFYPSTILIGKWWLALIPLLIVAFLALYVFKFSWEKWSGKPVLHLSFGIFGAIILLFIPLLFVTNVTSMLHPELWMPERGFVGSLFAYPTIWQRYAHFLAASFSMFGIFIYWWGTRTSLAATSPVRIRARQFGVNQAVLFTVLQLLAGPLLLISMPDQVRQAFMGGSLYHTTILSLAIGLAVVLTVYLFRLRCTHAKRDLLIVLALLVIVLGLMGTVRHEVRELHLAPHIQDMPRNIGGK